MKKLFIAFIVCFFSLNVLAGQTIYAKADADFINKVSLTAIDYWQIDDTNTTKGRTIYLPYSAKTVNDFKNIANIYSVTNQGYDHTIVQNSFSLTSFDNGEGTYQCVQLVKAVSNLYSSHTGDWSPDGEKIKTYNALSPGDVIATFGSDNKYNHGHTAIVIYVGSNYIYVVDQNFDLKREVQMHKLKITNRNNLSDLSRYQKVKWVKS